MKKILIAILLFTKIINCFDLASEWKEPQDQTNKNLKIVFLHTKTAYFYLGQTICAEDIPNLGFIFEYKPDLTIKELKEQICKYPPFSDLFNPNDLVILKSFELADRDKHIQERTVPDNVKLKEIKSCFRNNECWLIALNINEDKIVLIKQRMEQNKKLIAQRKAAAQKAEHERHAAKQRAIEQSVIDAEQEESEKAAKSENFLNNSYHCIVQ